MYIPVCFKPEADELLYSWLLRLAQAGSVATMQSILLQTTI